MYILIYVYIYTYNKYKSIDITNQHDLTNLLMFNVHLIELNLQPQTPH